MSIKYEIEKARRRVNKIEQGDGRMNVNADLLSKWRRERKERQKWERDTGLIHPVLEAERRDKEEFEEDILDRLERGEKIPAPNCPSLAAAWQRKVTQLKLEYEATND